MINVNYDKVADAVYFNLQEGKIVKTLELENKMIVDLNSKGGIVGIEILNYSSQQDVKKLEESIKEGIPVKITQKTPTAA